MRFKVPWIHGRALHKRSNEIKLWKKTEIEHFKKAHPFRFEGDRKWHTQTPFACSSSRRSALFRRNKVKTQSNERQTIKRFLWLHLVAFACCCVHSNTQLVSATEAAFKGIYTTFDVQTGLMKSVSTALHHFLLRPFTVARRNYTLPSTIVRLIWFFKVNRSLHQSRIIRCDSCRTSKHDLIRCL
jgi:hypothetical protein